MNRIWLGTVVAATILSVCVGQAAADPPLVLRDYRFIPSKTTVHVSGGPNDYNLDLTISGKFGLVTGYNDTPTADESAPSLEPYAKFVDVKGILYNPLAATPLPTPGWDLDQTLNMSGWSGTFSTSDPNELFFHGADGQGVAMLVEATLSGGWLQLTGGSSDPIGKDPVLYRINALAHVLPFPDFNNDGAVTAADLTGMEQALSDPQAFEAANSLSADDFTALADVNGDGVVNNADLQAMLLQLRTGVAANNPVPEPSAVVLLAMGGMGLLMRRLHPVSYLHSS